MSRATPRQRRALADLVGLDHLPDVLSQADAAAWLRNLRAQQQCTPRRHVLDGLWIWPAGAGDISGAGVFFWASDASWWRVPCRPRTLEIGETWHYRPVETLDATRAWSWADKIRPNPSPRLYPGGQWAERQPIEPIDPPRLALWRRRGLVSTALPHNRLGLPEIGGAS